MEQEEIDGALVGAPALILYPSLRLSTTVTAAAGSETILPGAGVLDTSEYAANQVRVPRGRKSQTRSPMGNSSKHGLRSPKY
jgi:hypothetical protein